MEEDFIKSSIQGEMVDLIRERDNSQFARLVEKVARENLLTSKRNRRIIYLSVVLSIAASLLLVLILVNPVERIKLHRYASNASETVQMPVTDLTNSVRGKPDQLPTSFFLEVRLVNDDNMEGHYFVREGILYLCSRDKNGTLIRKITVEGEIEYFYQLPSGKTFELNIKKENRLREFGETHP